MAGHVGCIDWTHPCQRPVAHPPPRVLVLKPEPLITNDKLPASTRLMNDRTRHAETEHGCQASARLLACAPNAATGRAAKST